MQQTLNARPWSEYPLYQRSRLKGALRFHALKLGKIVLWVLGILLAAQVIGILLTLVGVMKECSASGVAAEFGTEMTILLVFSCILAKSSTTFLTRFGTPRTSVWLSNLIALFISGAAFLLGSLVTSILTNYGILALSASNPAFTVANYTLSGGELVAASLSDALSGLPMLLLWTLEWSCLFYLLGCCLRRSKAITLTVCILLPLLVWVMMLLPVVRNAVELVENGNQTEIIMTGMQLLNWLSSVMQFVAKNWQWLQGLAALISLPLSWLCMRGTQQP